MCTNNFVLQKSRGISLEMASSKTTSEMWDVALPPWQFQFIQRQVRCLLRREIGDNACCQFWSTLSSEYCYFKKLTKPKLTTVSFSNVLMVKGWHCTWSEHHQPTPKATPSQCRFSLLQGKRRTSETWNNFPPSVFLPLNCQSTSSVKCQRH